MDPELRQVYDAANGYGSIDDDLFSSYGQSQYLVTGVHHDLELNVTDIPFLPLTLDPNSLASSSSVSYETEFSDDQDSSEVLNFLNLFMNEESLDERDKIFHDPLALQATEKSLYELIGHEYPDQSIDNTESITQCSSEYTSGSYRVTGFVDPQWNVDPSECNSILKQGHQKGFSPNFYVQEKPESISIPISGSQGHTDPNILLDSIGSTALVQNMFTNSDSILQFKRGMEEASKFLPTENKLIIDLDKYSLPEKSQDIMPVAAVKAEKDEPYVFDHTLRPKKHDYPEDGDSGNSERSRKHSAIFVEDVELSEHFERMLFCCDDNVSEFCNKGTKLPGSERGLLVSRSSQRSRTKKSNADPVDLLTLLITCAQSVAGDDRKTAYEQLKQIDQHLLHDGVAHNRLAHLFARGLRARLGGTGMELYASLTHKKMTASEVLKTYQVYLSTCPFKKLPIFFANEMIELAASKAWTLHIVDFGILYGFQWPVFIQLLSQRPGGPPKLRITGIDLPEQGFRPAERIEATGRRLEKYCQRFGVPFEYQAIASQNWEAIKLEDLNIMRDEVLAVNCLFRLGRLLDESVISDSPRDKLLRLIRKMKPDVFVNTVTNASYSAPFFLTRFKEALFHFSMMFDMLDAVLLNGNPNIADFVQQYYAREVVNIVACEGAERVERPETYKQWSTRHLRAGFKPRPLTEETMRKLSSKSKATDHKDFLFDKDGNWMLQGWKGRILSASSCWIPE